LTDPNPREVLIDHESEEELLGLYHDVLHRTSGPDPGALDRFMAWETTKEFWRVKRVGIDAKEVLQAVQRSTRPEQIAALDRELAHRGMTLSQAVANVRGLVALRKCLATPAESAAGPLRVVTGGRG
jgi:hypothetical protein